MNNKLISRTFLFSLISTFCFCFLYSWLGGGQISKMMVAFFAWCSYLAIPLPCFTSKYFDKKTCFVLSIFLFIIVIVLIKSLFFPTQSSPGNKILTLFGNPYCLLMMLVPIYIYMGNHKSSIRDVFSTVRLFLIYGFVFSFFYPKQYSAIVWFLPIFAPYIKKQYRLLAIIVVIDTIYTGFFSENTYRTNIIVLALCFCSYIIARYIKRRSLITIFCCVTTIIPLFYAILSLMLPDFSIFQYIAHHYLGGVSNVEMTEDTRTFLFRELAQDLSGSNNWLLGRGPDGQYFSAFFLESTSENADHYMRLNSEVTFLMNLLRGGVMYTFCYYFLLFYSMFKILKYGKSRLMLCVACIIATWIFVSALSMVHGIEILEVLMFTLVGCGLSSYWLKITDEEFYTLLK